VAGDLVSVVGDDEFFVFDHEGGGDVLVDDRLGHRQGVVEDAQLTVGADQANPLDPSGEPVEAGGDVEVGGWRSWGEPSPGFGLVWVAPLSAE